MRPCLRGLLLAAVLSGCAAEMQQALDHIGREAQRTARGIDRQIQRTAQGVRGLSGDINKVLGREAAGYPKASPDADVVLYLWSNENCEFFVDGVSVITGKAVRVLVTPREHRVICKPEGYRAKEEYIVPPFDPNHPIRFTFLIGDRLDAAENK